jgi:hypothetical protein
MVWELTYTEIGVLAAVFVGSTLVTTLIVGWFLIAIRPDHFVVDTRGLSRRIRSPVVRALYVAGKNLLGVVLVAVGVVLSLPGVPGQGLLTIFVGVLLLDIPGKRRFERKIVQRPRVLGAINRLRARFERPPLELAGVEDDPALSKPE